MRPGAPGALVAIVLGGAIAGLFVSVLLGKDPPSFDPIQIEQVVEADASGVAALMDSGAIGFFPKDSGEPVRHIWSPSKPEETAVDFDVSHRLVAIATTGGDVVALGTDEPSGSVGTRIWQSRDSASNAVAVSISGTTVAFAIASGDVFVHRLDEREVQRTKVWNGQEPRSPALSVEVGQRTVAWRLGNGNAFAQELGIDGTEGLSRIWNEGERVPVTDLAVTADGVVGLLLGNGDIHGHLLATGERRVLRSATQPSMRAMAIEAAGDLVVELLEDGSLQVVGIGPGLEVTRTEMVDSAAGIVAMQATANTVVAQSGRSDVRLFDVTGSETNQALEVPVFANRLQVID